MCVWYNPVTKFLKFLPEYIQEIRGSLYVEIKCIMVGFHVFKFGLFISVLYLVDELNGEEVKVIWET
jgi:hypothetical protein